MAKKTEDFLFKLVLIGDSGVGNTCVLHRFSDNVFCTSFIATVGMDCKIKTVELAGKKIKLQIWDTAGMERFRSLTTSYYKQANGVILVYDITDRSSFDNISNWLWLIEQHAKEDVETILLGNKCDLEKKRKISEKRSEQVARKHGIKFYETSAKTNINIENAFMTLATDILNKVELLANTPNREAENSRAFPQPQTPKRKGCC